MITSGKLLSKRSRDLKARFKIAYGRLSYSQRQVAKGVFCAAHGISQGTFRNKASGANSVSETEVEWMEEYNPYQQPQPQAA